MDIIVSDHLKSCVKTDNPKLLKQLVEAFSVNIPGASYSRAYKIGAWKGRKNYINSKGEFHTGMLFEVLRVLKKANCLPNIIDHRSDVNCSYKPIEHFTLYDYQEEAVKKCLKDKRLIVKAPTGSGKTLLSAALVNSLADHPGLIIFPSKALLKQTYDLFQKCGIECGVCFGEGFIPHDIMLVTAQSIEKVLGTHLEEAKFLIFDEVHEFASGKVRQQITKSFPNAEYRIGLTATVPTDKYRKWNLMEGLGDVYEVRTIQELIEDGKLSKPIIQMISFNQEAEDVNMPYIELYDQYISKNQKRNDLICFILQNIHHSRKASKTLVLCNSLSHMELLKERIPGAFSVEGKNSVSDRYDSIKEFLNSDHGIIIGTKVMQTGINIDELTHMINARGMKSDIATLQALGRLVRKDKDNIVYYYDIADKNIQYLEKHSNSRLKAYKKEKHDVRIINFEEKR